MIPEECPPQPYSGCLLLASPALQEATFHRTVILLSSHSVGEGAFGYILNRPVELSISDLHPMEGLDGLRSVPVFEGGPVGQDHLTFASLGWDTSANELIYETHLSSQDAVRHVAEGFSVRAFVGYSGWSAGQLENELELDSWELQTPAVDLVDHENMTQGMWTELVREISPIHRLEADLPDDVTLN
ncbi:MAG: YqgE/AlgH family protein [Verrucomicrobiota bacterium]